MVVVTVLDLTVTSLFPVLAVGGCVSVIEVGTELDAGALASVRDASLIKLTPRTCPSLPTS